MCISELDIAGGASQVQHLAEAMGLGAVAVGDLLVGADLLLVLLQEPAALHHPIGDGGII